MLSLTKFTIVELRIDSEITDPVPVSILTSFRLPEHKRKLTIATHRSNGDEVPLVINFDDTLKTDTGVLRADTLTRASDGMVLATWQGDKAATQLATFLDSNNEQFPTDLATDLRGEKRIQTILAAIATRSQEQ